jgi:TolB protein
MRALTLERTLVAVVVAAIVVPTSAATRSSPVQFPTAGQLVFSDDGALFTIAPDGSDLRELGELGAYGPRWSPSGERIAFASEDGQLWLIRGNGADLGRLTRPGKGAQDSSPAWSPRGGRLVHRRDAGSSAERSGLRVVAADASRGTWLSREAAQLRSPDWSPDGRRIVGHLRTHLWVVDAEGSNPRRLIPRGLVGHEPRYAPDGTRVAFVHTGAGDVRVVDLRTRRVRTVFTPEPETYEEESIGWAVAWSPDGRWLAVQWTNSVECVDDPTELWCSRAEIWIVGASGGQAKRIHAGPLRGRGAGLDWRRP